MNNKLKMILTIALVVSCIAYTLVGYKQGRTDSSMVIAVCLILGFPLVNIIRGLIDEFRK